MEINMELNEEKLKNIYVNMINKTPVQEKNCPSDDILFNAVINKQDQESKFKIIDHVFECSSCTLKFNAFRKLHKESGELSKDRGNIVLSDNEVKELVKKGENIIKSDKKEKYLFFKIPLKYISAIAATLIIVFGSVIFIDSQNALTNKNNIDYERGINNNSIKILSPKGSYKKKELIFKWNLVKDAEEYIVKLYNEELTCIWTSSKTKLDNFKYPSQLFKKLTKNKIYFWKLFVYYKSRENIESKLTNFKILN